MKKILTLLCLFTLVTGAIAQLNPEQMKKDAQKWLSRKNNLKVVSHPLPYAHLKSTAANNTLDSIVYDFGSKKEFTYNADGLVAHVAIYTDYYQDGSLLITETHSMEYDGNGNMTLYLVKKSDDEGAIDFYEMTSTYDAENRLTSEIISDYSQGYFQYISKTVNTYGETLRTDSYNYNPESTEGWELSEYVITHYKSGEMIDFQEAWELDEDTGEEVFSRFTYQDYKNNKPALIVGEQLDVETQEWTEVMRTESLFDSNGNVTSELMTINFFGSLIPMVQTTFGYDEKGRALSQGTSMLDFASGEMLMAFLVETIMENNTVKSVVWKERNSESNELAVKELWEFDMANTNDLTIIPLNYNYTDINSVELNDFLEPELFADGRIETITYSTTGYFMENKQGYIASYYYSENNGGDDTDDDEGDDTGGDDGDEDGSDTGDDTGDDDTGDNTGGNTGGETDGTNSITQSVLPFEMTLGPNPVMNELNIKTTENCPYKLIIRDYTGKICEQKTLVGNRTIAVENYAKGVYVIEIKSGTNTVQKIKLLKQ